MHDHACACVYVCTHPVRVCVHTHGRVCRACTHVCACADTDLSNAFRNPSHKWRIQFVLLITDEGTHSFLSPSSGGAERARIRLQNLARREASWGPWELGFGEGGGNGKEIMTAILRL